MGSRFSEFCSGVKAALFAEEQHTHLRVSSVSSASCGNQAAGRCDMCSGCEMFLLLITNEMTLPIDLRMLPGPAGEKWLNHLQKSCSQCFINQDPWNQ